jgi:hypothetical protein
MEITNIDENNVSINKEIEILSPGEREFKVLVILSDGTIIESEITEIVVNDNLATINCNDTLSGTEEINISTDLTENINGTISLYSYKDDKAYTIKDISFKSGDKAYTVDLDTQEYSNGFYKLMIEYSQLGETIVLTEKDIQISNTTYGTWTFPDFPNITYDEASSIFNGDDDCEYLVARLNSLNRSLISRGKSEYLWTEDKLEDLWQGAEEFSPQIDPYLLMAIIFHEGTGSFNTSTTNIASDGQSGAEEDFEKDLSNAGQHLIKKCRGYSVYGQEFIDYINETGVSQSLKSGGGSLVQYMNYKVPVYNSLNEVGVLGGYATNYNWWKGVTSIYTSCTSEINNSKYNEFIINQDLGLSHYEYAFYECELGQTYNGGQFVYEDGEIYCVVYNSSTGKATYYSAPDAESFDKYSYVPKSDDYLKTEYTKPNFNEGYPYINTLSVQTNHYNLEIRPFIIDKSSNSNNIDTRYDLGSKLQESINELISEEEGMYSSDRLLVDGYCGNITLSALLSVLPSYSGIESLDSEQFESITTVEISETEVTNTIYKYESQATVKDDVKLIQGSLNDWLVESRKLSSLLDKIPKLEEDGKFGSNTVALLTLYQEHNGFEIEAEVEKSSEMWDALMDEISFDFEVPNISEDKIGKYIKTGKGEDTRWELELSDKPIIPENVEEYLETLEKNIEEYIENNDLGNGKLDTASEESREKCLLKINDYFEEFANEGKLELNKTYIFMFEGAGDYDSAPDGWTNNFDSSDSYHKEGRYGAMTVAVENGEIVTIVTDATTLPDDVYNEQQPEDKSFVGYAMIDEGVYEFNTGAHKNNYGYISLHINDNGSVPATYGAKDERYSRNSSGIHFHYGYYAISPHSNSWNWSEGCLLIVGYYYQEEVENSTYGQFMVDLELVDEPVDGYIKEYHTYPESATETCTTLSPELNGYIIVDRTTSGFELDEVIEVRD